MYVRLTFNDAVNMYKTLEPLLEDKRKLRRRRKEGYTLTYMDEFVDELLTKDRVCGTSLWKLPSRQILEDEGRLEERVSPMQGELDEELEREEREGDDEDTVEVRNGGESESGRSAKVRYTTQQ
jgi:pre-mRNA-splicing factor 38A